MFREASLFAVIRPGKCARVGPSDLIAVAVQSAAALRVPYRWGGPPYSRRAVTSCTMRRGPPRLELWPVLCPDVAEGEVGPLVPHGDGFRTLDPDPATEPGCRPQEVSQKLKPTTNLVPAWRNAESVFEERTASGTATDHDVQPHVEIVVPVRVPSSKPALQRSPSLIFVGENSIEAGGAVTTCRDFTLE